MSTSSVKRNLTFRIGDEEVSVVAHRDGNNIVIERDEKEYTVQLVAESISVPAGGTVAPAPKPAPQAGATPAAPRPAPAARPAPVAAGPAGPGAIVAPMVGSVKEVLVAAGATVAEGERVVVLEAMKMDIDVLAHDAGTVAEVFVSAGDNVTEGQQLLRVEA